VATSEGTDDDALETAPAAEPLPRPVGRPFGTDRPRVPKDRANPDAMHPYSDRIKEQRRVRVMPPDAIRYKDDGRAGGRSVIWAYGRRFLYTLGLLDKQSSNPRQFWRNRVASAGLDEDDMFAAFALAVRARLGFRPDRSGALVLVAAALEHLAAVLAGRDLLASRKALRAAAKSMVASTDEEGTVQGASPLPDDHEPE
jgi:hypothetical protein